MYFIVFIKANNFVQDTNMNTDCRQLVQSYLFYTLGSSHNMVCLLDPFYRLT